ncbi:MAG: hypothetical protein IPO72_07835 [Saprospiraceae bacterium]|nr:hypothetical protein [Candidatus Vicinibacter affinis]MBK6571271.1 hypothetical protein [Candidatus Vicinibacter affinis]MBK7303518.1 hypothetical protein [Candidatus Vicinibacter affinis]MBK7696548.1 hypothetical protein [Candidatus Vicinibacter affinis]MBK7696913.1 hypothetical protein [Candidatus Vicinibacter affinis]
MTKTIKWKGIQGEYSIHVSRLDQFTECIPKDLEDNLFPELKVAMKDPGFDIKNHSAFILKGVVDIADRSALRLDLQLSHSNKSTDTLIDDILREEAQALFPDNKLFLYSSRMCNHFERQHCWILQPKDS